MNGDRYTMRYKYLEHKYVQFEGMMVHVETKFGYLSWKRWIPLYDLYWADFDLYKRVCNMLKEKK